MQDKLVVTIIRTHPKRELGTLEEEAENIRECLLDAIGYPDSVDFEVTVHSIEVLEE